MPDVTDGRRASSAELPSPPTDGALANGSVAYGRALQATGDGAAGSSDTPLGFEYCSPLSIQEKARCVIVGVDLSNNGLVGTISNDPASSSAAAADSDGGGSRGLCDLAELNHLDLSSNQIRGSLPADQGSESCLPMIRELDLSINQITGKIPQWITTSTQLRYLNLEDLELTYPDTETLRRQELKPLVQMCNTNAVQCTGLPPQSCDAFRTAEGDPYKARSDDPEECVACRDLVGPIVLMAACFILLFLAIAGYVYMISRYGQDFLKRWVSTVGIMLNHIQTVGIIGNLSIQWPPAVIWITTTLSGNIFDLSFVRPECLLVTVDVSPFYMFTLGACGLILFILFIFSCIKMVIVVGLSRCVSRESASKMVDSVEFLQSIIFSTQLVPTWQIGAQLMVTAFSGDLTATLGGVMAFVLLLVDASYCIYYYVHIRRIARERGQIKRLHGSKVALELTLERQNGQKAKIRSELAHGLGVSSRFGGSGLLKARRGTVAVGDGGDGAGGAAHGVVVCEESARPMIYVRRVARMKLSERCCAEDDRFCCADECGVAELDVNMEYRMSYLTDRFAYSEPLWQFVVWLRQILVSAQR